MKRVIITVLTMFACLVLTAAVAQAIEPNVTASWTHEVPDEVHGYKLYQRFDITGSPQKIAADTQLLSTNITVPDGRYCFKVAAYIDVAPVVITALDGTVLLEEPATINESDPSAETCLSITTTPNSPTIKVIESRPDKKGFTVKIIIRGQ